jgi:hypothetical protein
MLRLSWSQAASGSRSWHRLVRRVGEHSVGVERLIVLAGAQYDYFASSVLQQPGDVIGVKAGCSAIGRGDHDAVKRHVGEYFA